MDDYNKNHYINEKYLATAVNFLFQTGHASIAKALAGGEIEHIEYEVSGNCTVFLRLPPKLFVECQECEGRDGDTYDMIWTSLNAAIRNTNGFRLDLGVVTIEPDLNWRTQLIAADETQIVTNQNPYEKKPLVYDAMRFSSPAEVKIAQAFDNKGVMYFPNCLVRVGTPNNRLRRIPDFVVCYQGKWGILEIDGAKFHSGQATQDHDRTRALVREGGFSLFDRYDAKRCMNEPNQVVDEFLKNLLAQK